MVIYFCAFAQAPERMRLLYRNNVRRILCTARKCFFVEIFLSVSPIARTDVVVSGRVVHGAPENSESPGCLGQLDHATYHRRCMTVSMASLHSRSRRRCIAIGEAVHHRYAHRGLVVCWTTSAVVQAAGLLYTLVSDTRRHQVSESLALGSPVLLAVAVAGFVVRFLRLFCHLH